jgi:calcium-dependent protein kinase
LILGRLGTFKYHNQLTKEVMKVMVDRLQEQEIIDLKKQFQILDTHKTGFITFDELSDTLKQFGIKI